MDRKLLELGYNRDARKCKEKFENIQTYHKQAKDQGKAGGQYGRDYCFSGQLEAFHNITATSTTSTINPVIAPPIDINTTSNTTIAIANTSLSLSKTTAFFSSSDDSMVKGTNQKGQKRKREKESKTNKMMMTFFKKMMRLVVEREDAMQHQFLEALEKQEQYRMVREETWRRQEMARLTHEKELVAQERAAMQAREQAIITFLHKIIISQAISIPPLSTTTIAPTLQPSSTQQQQQQQSSNDTEITIIPITRQQKMLARNATKKFMSSKWPKIEVNALIKLCTDLEPYHREGLKGPLWEQIAMEMQQLGYNRSAKKCKEKWENINRYFKKLKESNKNWPKNLGTCTYFHQLDAFYRSKSPSQISHVLQQPESNPDPDPTQQVGGNTLIMSMLPSQLHVARGTGDAGSHANNNNTNEKNSGSDVGCSNTDTTSRKVIDGFLHLYSQ